jgi:hypothetical protein
MDWVLVLVLAYGPGYQGVTSTKSVFAPSDVTITSIPGFTTQLRCMEAGMDAKAKDDHFSYVCLKRW